MDRLFLLLLFGIVVSGQILPGQNPYQLGCDIVTHCFGMNVTKETTLTTKKCLSLGADCSAMDDYDFQLDYNSMIQNYKYIIEANPDLGLGVEYGQRTLDCENLTFGMPVRNPTYAVSSVIGQGLGVDMIFYISYDVDWYTQPISTYHAAQWHLEGQNITLSGYASSESSLEMTEITGENKRSIETRFSPEFAFDFENANPLFLGVHSTITPSCTEDIEVSYAYLYAVAPGPPKPEIQTSQTVLMNGELLFPLDTGSISSPLYSEYTSNDLVIRKDLLASLKSSITLQAILKLTEDDTSMIMYMFPNCPINTTCYDDLPGAIFSEYTLQGYFGVDLDHVFFVLNNATVCDPVDNCFNILESAMQRRGYIVSELPVDIVQPTTEPGGNSTGNGFWDMNGAAWLNFGILIAIFITLIIFSALYANDMASMKELEQIKMSHGR